MTTASVPAMMHRMIYPMSMSLSGAGRCSDLGGLL